mmetsp:Transcript_10398/g.15965  ORF Transcript_10398/g.15965 Transcript_10398/m.15965 type:complete len:439 (+) Transcript_10398:142-1458(+)|eukprot:CAMPEP_0178900896 /NCGR_PEP_ID=MMETSP0786-20121207/3719_1 /TAXON_ID=186022 /ORGANISM="Thalassionema frauenfeldii, Strain CCMP 1798" /LENGTH=438 /DNA_ID=CAMNT_0020571933 /DNA_START=85 /DNA_END=1401 /DNA_ORIENTATION=+
MSEIQESFCASAPGKIIIFGEHAVVYGEPAIAASLADLRTMVKVTVDSEKAELISVRFPDFSTTDVTLQSKGMCFDSLNSPPTANDATLLREAIFCQVPALDESSTSALVVLIYLLNILTSEYLHHGLEITVRSNFPMGAGLGSSAAFSVALTAALLRLKLALSEKPSLPPLGRPAENHLDTINTYAFYAETLLHGNPSGIDNSVSTYGGGICYTKDLVNPGKGSMERFRMPPLSVMLVNTNVPKSTKALVASVRTMYEEHPEVVGCILKCIGEITQEFRNLVEKKETKNQKVLTLVNTNQHMLRSVGVSHESLDHVCHVTETISEGQAATKLTGAGGGGCAMIVLQTNECNNSVSIEKLTQKIQKALEGGWHRWKFNCFRSSLGGDGALWVDPKIFPSTNEISCKDCILTCDYKALKLACLSAVVGLGFLYLRKSRR